MGHRRRSFVKRIILLHRQGLPLPPFDSGAIKQLFLLLSSPRCKSKRKPNRLLGCTKYLATFHCFFQLVESLLDPSCQDRRSSVMPSIPVAFFFCRLATTGSTSVWQRTLSRLPRPPRPRQCTPIPEINRFITK